MMLISDNQRRLKMEYIKMTLEEAKKFAKKDAIVFDPRIKSKHKKTETTKFVQKIVEQSFSVAFCFLIMAFVKPLSTMTLNSSIKIVNIQEFWR